VLESKGEHACNIRIDIDQQITCATSQRSWDFVMYTGRFVSCFEVAPRLETSIFATNVPNVGKYQKREHSGGQGWYPGEMTWNSQEVTTKLSHNSGWYSLVLNRVVVLVKFKMPLIDGWCCDIFQVRFSSYLR
jgi:hypothetical protein